jgi:hypothetical protein
MEIIAIFAIIAVVFFAVALVCLIIDGNIFARLVAVAVVVIIIYSITWNLGFKKGQAETYEPTKIVAAQTYEAEIADLQKQINAVSQTYESDVADLRKKQMREITVLETKQATEIVNLQEEKETEVSFTQIKHNDELKETQETYYVKGQADIRSSIQNQIDSKARENMLKNDWDAPVFSTRR